MLIVFMFVLEKSRRMLKLRQSQIFMIFFFFFFSSSQRDQRDMVYKLLTLIIENAYNVTNFQGLCKSAILTKSSPVQSSR